MMKVSHQRGFTLIELMIVMAIIAVLATLGVTNFSAATKRARDGVRKSDISSIAQALVLYRSDFGNYPAIPSGYGAAKIVGLSTAYIREIPADPLKKDDYVYWTNTDKKKFVVCTKLEMAAGNYNENTGGNGTCSIGMSDCVPTKDDASNLGKSTGGKGCCQCVFSP